MSEEIWVQCLAYPKYEVSNLGRVRTIATGYIKKHVTQTKGFKVVWLAGPFKKNYVHVASLVMWAFHPEILNESFVVRYRDGNKSNLRFDNLYYSSKSEMISESWKLGKYKNRPPFQFPKGPANPRHRLHQIWKSTNQKFAAA